MAMKTSIACVEWPIVYTVQYGAAFSINTLSYWFYYNPNADISNTISFFMTAIRYTQATVADTAILTEFRLKLLHDVRGKDDDETTAQIRQNNMEYFPRAIASGQYFGWFARVDGAVAGAGGFAIREQPPSYKYTNGKLAYVMNMYTLPQYRGMGIASALMERILEAAQQLGIQKIELHATHEGEPIYRKYGFAEPKSIVLEMQL
jgi:GNAT superfamily N-acetyltransferase